MGKPRYQLCFLQQAFTQETPVIEGFCDKLLIGNQMRFVLLSKGAQLVLCDVNVYGGKNVLFSLSLCYIRLIMKIYQKDFSHSRKMNL